MRFEGKTGIVTGGGQGIGEQIARRLAQEGASVIIGDIHEDAAARVAGEIGRETGNKALHMKTDVRIKKDIEALVDAGLKEFSRIDILVNNAGICKATPIEDISEEEWDEMLNINLKGVFLCSQAVMPVFKKQKSGRIVSMASIAGKVGGLAAGAHYSASKAGVICLTKTFAKALAPYGVTVNAIAPGPVATEMLNTFTDEARAGLLGQILTGRFADINDISEAALYLLSDAAKHVTGETLNVNGGMFMD